MLKEVAALKRVTHPHILPYQGIYRMRNDDICVVTPWAEGGPLMAYLQQTENADRSSLVCSSHVPRRKC